MSDDHFTPSDFLDLLESERRWMEVVVSAMRTRTTIREIDVKRLADDTVARFLTLRIRELRN